MTEDRFKHELIEALARKCPNPMGRTALMKFMYFLQTLRNVPLGYRFSLYSYGPFDSSVLTDLGEAELFGYVTSRTVDYSSGYGYEIKEVEPASESELLEKYGGDIDWVIGEFGTRNSADLELASTIIFADREEEPASQEIDGLVRKVHQVKPHFDEDRISQRIDELQRNGLIHSLKSR